MTTLMSTPGTTISKDTASKDTATIITWRKPTTMIMTHTIMMRPSATNTITQNPGA